MGPVDYVVVRFPGNKFNGEIAPELARLEQNRHYSRDRPRFRFKRRERKRVDY